MLKRVLFISLLTHSVVFAQTGINADIEADMTRPNIEPQLTLEDLRTFSDVFAAVRQYYVEDVDDRDLLQAALRGMLSELDPHSEWLDASAFTDVEESATGRYGGLGIEFQIMDGFYTVITAVDGTPAAKAGIKPGDRITAVDGKLLELESINSAVKVMRGEPGTDVELEVQRPATGENLTLNLTRRIIQTNSVRGRLIEEQFAYVRIASFQEETADQVEGLIKQLREERGDELKGLVIDVRNNPGGVLYSAVQAADLFLDAGMVVSTRGRSPDSFMEFPAKRRMLMEKNIPIVVLVNGGSASAAEILAAALQDHGRAIIIGQRTFGKGSVQSVLPLRNGSGIRLTTSRYYTPNERPIQLEGVTPDIILPRVEVRAAQSGPREADLNRRLEGETENAGNHVETDIPPLAEEDYALFEAINLLKSIALAAGR